MGKSQPTTTSGRRPLGAHARRQLEAQFRKLDAARDELDLIERQRKRHSAGSTFGDLARRAEAACVAWDEAIFTLRLGLGDTPDEAAKATHDAARERLCDAERAKRDVSRPNDDTSDAGAIVRPLDRQRRHPRPAESAEDPWMTSRESGAYARKLSPNGQISSGWRKTLKQLEARGLAHRQGKYPNSSLRTRRSTVDAVLRGEINFDEGDDGE